MDIVLCDVAMFSMAKGDIIYNIKIRNMKLNQILKKDSMLYFVHQDKNRKKVLNLLCIFNVMCLEAKR